LATFVEKSGTEYSKLLGIDLKNGKDEEIFKWFLVSVLFGAPITESAAIKAYKCLQKHDVLTPQEILKTGWDGLVKIFDEGSYTRYDFKTADKLLEVMKNLMGKYDGSLNIVHEKASDDRNLEQRLKELGKGIGDVTVSIFLRELRPVWKRARPKPTSLVISAAENLGLIKGKEPEDALMQLEGYWRKNEVKGKSFVNFETALVRLGKDLRREKCGKCHAKIPCQNPAEP